MAWELLLCPKANARKRAKQYKCNVEFIFLAYTQHNISFSTHCEWSFQGYSTGMFLYQNNSLIISLHVKGH